MTFGFDAISVISTMIGTAVTPLMTALQNSALIGSIDVKSSARPTIVASTIIATTGTARRVPGAARLPPHRLGALGEFSTGDHDATLEQQLLDVAYSGEPKIPANRAADDDTREAVAVIERFRLLHRLPPVHQPDSARLSGVPVFTRESAQTFIEPCSVTETRARNLPFYELCEKRMHVRGRMKVVGEHVRLISIGRSVGRRRA
jgi:hypothetical protein